MKSYLCPHLVPDHFGQDELERLRAWDARALKLVFDSSDKIPYLKDVAAVMHPDSFFVLRNHPISENWHKREQLFKKEDALKMADAHATAWHQIILESLKEKQITPELLSRCFFEGLNEPLLWRPGESPDLIAIYYQAFAEQMWRSYGLRSVVLNIGVGWPTNHDVKDAIADWTPFKNLMQTVLETGSLVGLHEYWSEKGIEFEYGWNQGRFNMIPFDVPLIITETGFDNLVIGKEQLGWQLMAANSTLDAAADKYVYKQLGIYDVQLSFDPRIKAAFIFTEDFSRPWASFDTRPTAFHERLRTHLNWYRENSVKPDVFEKLRLALPEYNFDVPWNLNPEPPVPPVEGFWCAFLQTIISWLQQIQEKISCGRK